MNRRNRTLDTFSLGNDPLWYKDAIIYELPVKAFTDWNGDGIGDFPGLIQRLDYLQDLGITALWLLPFYPSPLRDDGYDISDYTAIHPSYGTLADFRAFLREARRRGLRVISELVLNHTSDQHPWFQQARRSPPGSRKRDFYVWSDTPEKYKDARVIFKDFEPSNWSWDSVANAYYWHRFYAHQPDLNYDHPAVHNAVLQVVDFWLGMGIDGVRLDAVPYLYEREGTNCENLPETHAFLAELRKHVDAKFKNRMLLAEANQWPEDAVAYFGQGNECHMAFHFPLMPRLFMAIHMEDRFPIIDILQQTPPLPETSQWALFLRNHDELTLEMVTDEDRDYMYRVYGQDPQARINLGIRRRLAPLLENHRAKIELMNGLLFSLPGTPVLYYGDEIGMGDNIYLGDRNGVRTPMQWNADRNAGFSRANPQRLYLPIIIDPAYHYEAVNVEVQQNNQHSLLWWMKHLIALRKRYRAFGRGSLEMLSPENHKVVAFVRRYQDERILVVANLSRFIQSAELELDEFKGLQPVEMLGRTRFPPIGEHPYFLTLGSYAFYWFCLEPVLVPRAVVSAPEDGLPTLEVSDGWERIFSGRAKKSLNEVLPDYFKRCPWFRNNAGRLEAATVVDAIPFGHASEAAYITLVQVSYSEGDPEIYLLPLAYVTGESADEVQGALPHALVARLQVHDDSTDGTDGTKGLIYDPIGDRNFSRAIVDSIIRRRRSKRAGGEVFAFSTRLLRRLLSPTEPLPEPTPLKTPQSNTSVFFGDRLILKVFRHIEDGINPDLEVGRFLAEKTSFTHVPPLAGALEYQSGKGKLISLAVLHGFVPNQGDAWQLTHDHLSRYFEHVLAGQVSVGDLATPSQPIWDQVEGELPAQVHEVIGSFLELVRLLAQRTAELHVALASGAEEPNFAPEAFTPMYQRSLYQSIRAQARQTFGLLSQLLRDLPGPLRHDAERLLGLEGEILKRARAILERRITALRIRCHSNYHLGEVLFTGKDFCIIDFGGDAVRPWSDRLRKRSGLRDVATMLRSFQVASLSALQTGHVRPEDIATLQPWVRFWQVWVSITFVKAYLQAASGAAFLPKTRSETGMLLDFYLLKRLVQELRYELGDDQERLPIALQGLLRFLEGPP